MQDALKSRPLLLLILAFFALYFIADWREDGSSRRVRSPAPAAGGGLRPPVKEVVIDHTARDVSQTPAAPNLSERLGNRRPPPPPPRPNPKPGSGDSDSGRNAKPTAPQPTPKPKPTPPQTLATPPAKPKLKPADRGPKPSLPAKLDPATPTRIITDSESQYLTRGRGNRPLHDADWVDKYVNNPNNVVMGLANTYPWHYVRRFVCSLRATGYIGKIVLGGASWPDNTRAHFAAADVIPEVYDGGRAGSDLLTYRFELFRQWATKYDTGDNLMLVTDIRDSYFQRNPFEDVEWMMTGPNGQSNYYDLHLFEESGYLTHRNETINRDWMGQCFGTIEDMIDKRIINGGALFGTGSGIARGSKLLYERATSGKHCNGRDQVYLNKLFHTGEMGPHVISHAQGEAGVPMNVIGYLPRTDGAPFAHPQVVRDLHPGLMIDEWGYVLDHDKRTRSATLHQYDRFNVIDQLIMRLQPHWYTKEGCTWKGGKKIAEGIIDW